VKTLTRKDPGIRHQVSELSYLSQNPSSSVIHRSIPPAISTWADGSRPPRLTPSSPVKDQSPTSSHPWANLLSPIDTTPASRPSCARSVLSRCQRTAGALVTNDAARRSRGGGGDRNRTDDLLLAKQALSQLSYTPTALGEAQSPSRRQRRPCAAKAASRRTERSPTPPGCRSGRNKPCCCRVPAFCRAKAGGGPGRI
jgi:hypothetical protein